MSPAHADQPMRPSWSPRYFGKAAATSLIAVIALAACSGGGESTKSTSTTSGPTSVVAVQPEAVVEGEQYRESTSGDGPGSTVDIYVGNGDEEAPLVVLLHGYDEGGPGRPNDYLGALGEDIAELGSTVFSFGWQTTEGLSADSVADLSCVGPFVAARATEFGADADNVVVVGHSMGAETGSMLAFSSFDLDPSPDCTETGQVSSPVAYLGIGGAYGMVGGPLDDAETRFRVRTAPDSAFQELDADEEVRPGLSAAQLYQLDGYRSVPPVDELDIVLLVGSEDQHSVTDGVITAAFAEALRVHSIDVEVVTIEGANHDDVVDPATEAGQATLQVVAEVLANTQ